MLANMEEPKLNVASLWIKLMILVLSITIASSRLDCVTDTDNTLHCTAETNADFALLSSVAGNIKLSFKSGHSVVFEDSLFPTLPALHNLTIDLQHIVDLSSGAFKQLTSLQSLQLENSDPYRPLPELSFLEETLAGLSTLKQLNIEEIGLTEIQSGAFNDLINLTELTIKQNQIQSLPVGILSATKLQLLTLTKMGMIQISSATFQGLNQLTTLHISYNKLSSLGPSLFSNMINLEDINIENNELSSLSTDSFKGLINLKRLDLNNNNITRLQYGLFTDQTKLETLDVIRNNIEVVDDGVFENLSNLVFLKLTYNNIQRISSETFKGLSNLQFLNLENNGVAGIAAQAFSDSPNMLVLHLHNNKLTTIDQDAFTGVDTNILTLHDNQLSTLPMGIFDPFKSLNLLDLSNNPWRCDCEITWLYDWLQKMNPSFLLDNSDDTTCASPAGMTGVTLTQYIQLRYTECLPTTSIVFPSTTEELTSIQTTTQTTTSTVVPSTVVELTSVQTAMQNTTNSTIPIGGVDDENDSVIPKAGVIALVVVLIFLAVLIVVLTVLAMYCRQKKYAFWAPPKTDKPDGKPSNDLKFKAKHQVGSFYQDPETGRVSSMWERESMRSEHRYVMDPTSDDDGTDNKNKYVYENMALDASDANDNSVVVVDSNGTTVKEMPPSYINGYAGSDHQSSKESVHSISTGEPSPVPAHGYTANGSMEPSIRTRDLDPGDYIISGQEGHKEYEMQNLEAPTNDSPYPPDVRPEVPQEPQAHVDSSHMRLSIDDDYEHLHTEPQTPESAHDYTGLQPESESHVSPVRNSIADAEADYEGLTRDLAQVQQGLDTDAHGGNVGFRNEAFDFSDEDDQKPYQLTNESLAASRNSE